MAENKIKAKSVMISGAEGLPATLDNSRFCIFPGFCDVHVHYREPGFSYKETIFSGSEAAAHGGFTAVCAMPNLNPVPDSKEHLEAELELINKAGLVKVFPYGAITIGEKGEELSRMEEISKNIIAFSDDGKGVQSPFIMEKAMLKAKALGKIIAAHEEDNSLLKGGYIHDGEYAKEYGHKGICSESEWGPIKRDLELAKKTGCAFHVCHVSTKESVELIRKAKKDGVDVTCETAPHYLLLDENDLEENGRFKMNPPLRGTDDRLALIEGIKDGTIDMIATDHAPHSKEEKAKGLESSAFGIVGLETAFPLLYTYLVKPGVISLEKLIELMSVNPAKRFGIDMAGDYTVWDLESKYRIDPEEFLSMGRATPFEGTEVFGKCMLTQTGGKIVYADELMNLPEGQRHR